MKEWMVWVLLAAVVLLALVPLRGPVHPPAPQLSFTIKAEKTKLLVGEPLKIQMRIRNETGNDLELQTRLSFGCFNTLSVTISRDGGKTFQPYTSRATLWLVGQTCWLNLIPLTLKAGEEWKGEEFISFHVASFDSMSNVEGDFAFPKAGKYQVKMTLRSFTSGEIPRQPYLLLDKEILSESNIVEVKVVEPKGKDKEALQFIVDNQLKPFLTPEATFFPVTDEVVQKLQEFLEKFPDSPYAPYVQLGLEAICQGRREELPACWNISQEQKQPLELSIATDKTKVLVGEPVQLKLKLKNNSDKDLTGVFYLTFLSGTLHVLITPVGQPEFLYWPASLQMAETAEIPLRLVTLKAGEEVEGKEFISYDVKKKDFALPAAGKYQLRAEQFFDPDDLSKKVESQGIAVEVVDPQSQEDKDALQFIVDKQLKADLTPEASLVPPLEGRTVNDEVQLLQEFLKKFPTSTYVPYVLAGLNAICQGRAQELPACSGGQAAAPIQVPCPPTAPESFCVLSGHSSFVYTVAFSPDSKLLASGSCVSSGPPEMCEAGEIRLWEVSTGRLVNVLLSGRFWVLGLAFSPDGRFLAAGSSDYAVYLWDVSTGNLLQTLGGHRAPVWAVAFSPDGQLLASASTDGTVRLWEPTGKLVRVLNAQSGVNDVAFSPDGRLIAAALGQPNNAVLIWEVSSGQLVRVLQGHTDEVIAVAFDPGNKFLASGSSDTTVRLWEVASGKPMQMLALHTLPVPSVAFSPKGNVLACGSVDRTIHLWGVASGALMRTLRGHTNSITAVAFSPDGKLVASGSLDMTIRLWYVGDLTEQGG
jgi:hypothetical protein